MEKSREAEAEEENEAESVISSENEKASLNALQDEMEEGAANIADDVGIVMMDHI